MPLPWSAIKKMREERAALVAETEKLLRTPEGEKREMTEDDQAKFDAQIAQADELRQEIEREERLYMAGEPTAGERRHDRHRDDARRELGGADDAGDGEAIDDEKREAEIEEAFERYIRTGSEDELRDLATTPDASGGFMVPKKVHALHLKKLADTDAIRRAGATIVADSTSGPYDVPTIDDTANTGEQRAEGAADDDADPTFGRANLQDYRFDSDAVPISNQMLIGRESDLEPVIYRLMQKRIAKIQQQRFTTGTGSSQPRGAFTAAAVGVTAAAAGALAYQDIVALYYSVAQEHRDMAKWMLSDLTAAAIASILDQEGRPLFKVSTVFGTPDLILGKPVVYNNAAPAIAASAKPIAFGDWSEYYIRDVGRLRIGRNPYSRMNKDQVVFHGFHNAGGDLADSQAIKVLQMNS